MSKPINEMIKDQLADDFNAVSKGTEQLFQQIVTEGGEKMAAIEGSIEQSLAMARNRLSHLQQLATEKGCAVARSTDAYVHQSPWKSIGMVAGLSVVIGVAAGLFLNRRG